MAKTQFKNVYIRKNQGRPTYRGEFIYKGNKYYKEFSTPEEAAKWVDLKCLELGIPQKNNTFKKK